MTGNLIGVIIGLVIAGADFVVLRMLAGRVELPETKQVLSITGYSQFVLLPIIGWFVGPYIFGE